MQQPAMSIRPVTPIRKVSRAQRLASALLTAWVSLGLMVLALPPELGATACAMACSVNERSCCCKGPPAWATVDGRGTFISTPALHSHDSRCPPLSSTSAGALEFTPLLARTGTEPWLVDSGTPAHRDTARPGRRILDLSLLPRPPPALSLGS